MKIRTFFCYMVISSLVIGSLVISLYHHLTDLRLQTVDSRLIC